MAARRETTGVIAGYAEDVVRYYDTKCDEGGCPSEMDSPNVLENRAAGSAEEDDGNKATSMYYTLLHKL